MNITRRNFLLSNIITIAVPSCIYANKINDNTIIEKDFQKIVINPDPIYLYSLKQTYSSLDNIKALLTENIYEEYILNYDIQVFNTYKNFNKLMESLPDMIPFDIDYIKDNFYYNQFINLQDYYFKFLNGYKFNYNDTLNVIKSIKSIGEYNYTLLINNSNCNIPKKSIIYNNIEKYSLYKSLYSFI